jgi:hypothetical protein
MVHGVNLADFWKWADTSALGATIVGGLIVAAIVGAIAFVISRVPKWRAPVFGGIRRFFRWVTSVRVTTRGRLEDLRNAPTVAAANLLEKHLRKIAGLKADHQFEILKIEKHWKDKDQKRMEESSTAWHQIEQKRFEEGRKKGRAEGKAAAEYGIVRVPDEFVSQVRPPPRPRWLLYRLQDSGDNRDFVLSNPVARSYAQEVRLEESSGRFQFHDAAHWQDLSGPDLKEFRGDIDDMGWVHGLRFEVEWLDHNGEQNKATVTLPPADRDLN